jgi:hypothetical protein
VEVRLKADTTSAKNTKISVVTRFFAIILLASIFTACRGAEQKAPAPASTEPAFNLTIQPVAAPAGEASSQPQLTASDRGVILSWLEQKDVAATLKFSELTSDAWPAAKAIASSKNWFISDADVPTVMRMSDGTLVAATYPLIDYQLEAYELGLSYSKDEGKTWSRPIAPHHDKTKTQHGFASLFEMPDKSLGLVWLDGRDMALSKAPEGGAMDVYFASFDSSWKQTAESSINARVCECCQTSAAMTADGPIVAFRDRTTDDIRDIHVTRINQGKWTDATAVHDDKWKIDACPVNGPAVAARGTSVAVAWFTAINDEGHAYAAFSPDTGRTWGAPIRLDDGSALGHVDLEMLDDGSAVATWVEFANERSQFRARKVVSSGGRSAAVVLAGQGDARVSGYPRVAKRGTDLVFAWTESSGPGTQVVKTAVGKLK